MRCAHIDITAEFLSGWLRYALFFRTCIDPGRVGHGSGFFGVTGPHLANAIDPSGSVESDGNRIRICILVREIAGNILAGVSPGACDDLPQNHRQIILVIERQISRREFIHVFLPVRLQGFRQSRNIGIATH